MENISIADIATIVGILVLLYTKFFSKSDKRKVNGENEETVAKTGKLALDSTAHALSISKEAIRQVNDVRIELTSVCAKYEKEIAELKVDIEKLQFEAEEKEAVIESLKDWAERLVNQVKTYAPAGVEPVKMKTPRKEKKTDNHI